MIIFQKFDLIRFGYFIITLNILVRLGQTFFSILGNHNNSERKVHKIILKKLYYGTQKTRTGVQSDKNCIFRNLLWKRDF